MAAKSVRIHGGLMECSMKMTLWVKKSMEERQDEKNNEKYVGVSGSGHAVVRLRFQPDSRDDGITDNGGRDDGG